MRWTTRKNKYNEWENREVTFFAWLPVHCGDDFRWLETVIIRQFWYEGEWRNSFFIN